MIKDIIERSGLHREWGSRRGDHSSIVRSGDGAGDGDGPFAFFERSSILNRRSATTSLGAKWTN